VSQTATRLCVGCGGFLTTDAVPLPLYSSAAEVSFEPIARRRDDSQLLGTDVTRRVREHEQRMYALASAAGREPPSRMVIIGISGNVGSKEHEELARAAGQDAVLPKPVPWDELRRMLQGLIVARPQFRVASS